MNTQAPTLLATSAGMDERMPMAESHAVMVSRVRKSYGLRPVLRDVSLTVAAGQRIAQGLHDGHGHKGPRHARKLGPPFQRAFIDGELPGDGGHQGKENKPGDVATQALSGER